jgi:hypothetical protein
MIYELSLWPRKVMILANSYHRKKVCVMLMACFYNSSPTYKNLLPLRVYIFSLITSKGRILRAFPPPLVKRTTFNNVSFPSFYLRTFPFFFFLIFFLSYTKYTHPLVETVRSLCFGFELADNSDYCSKS